jgi:hypothetical protein
VHAGLMTTAVAANCPSDRREADVRISVLTTGIDDVKIEKCELQRTFVRRRSELQ